MEEVNFIKNVEKGVVNDGGDGGRSKEKKEGESRSTDMEMGGKSSCGLLRWLQVGVKLKEVDYKVKGMPGQIWESYGKKLLTYQQRELMKSLSLIRLLGYLFCKRQLIKRRLKCFIKESCMEFVNEGWG